jgi:hypothetical protein
MLPNDLPGNSPHLNGFLLYSAQRFPAEALRYQRFRQFVSLLQTQTLSRAIVNLLKNTLKKED